MSWFSDIIGKVPVVGPAINAVAHNVLDPLARGAVNAIPGGSMVLGLGDKLGGMIPQPGGGAGGSSGGGSGGNGINPMILALAGLQTANAANLGKKANDYSDKAFNFANDSYNQRSGLRSTGINNLLSPKAADLSGLAAIRNQNPVATRAGAGAPISAPPSPMMMAGLPSDPTPSQSASMTASLAGPHGLGAPSLNTTPGTPIAPVGHSGVFGPPLDTTVGGGGIINGIMKRVGLQTPPDATAGQGGGIMKHFGIPTPDASAGQGLGGGPLKRFRATDFGQMSPERPTQMAV